MLMIPILQRRALLCTFIQVCGKPVLEYWSSSSVSRQYHFHQRRCEEQAEGTAKLTAAAKSAQRGVTTGNNCDIVKAGKKKQPGRLVGRLGCN